MQAQLTRIFSTPMLAVDYHDGAGDTLVISFSSIGHDPTRLPSPEFVASATGHRHKGTSRRALFIMDQGRSWGNDPQFDEILRAAYAQALSTGPVRSVVAVGLSMGAYTALIAAQILPVTCVLAFGPQYSLALAKHHPAWKPWICGITQPRWSVAPLPPPPCQTYLVHGLRDDLPHAQAFPPSEGMDHILFDDLGHSELMPHLKLRGCLDGLINAALSQDRRRILRIFQSAGGRRLKEGWPEG